MKTTYSHVTIQQRPVVLRHDRYYPKGRRVARLTRGEDPVRYIARCVAEDVANRLRKVTDYLADRKARPAPVVVPSNQLDLF